MASLRPRAAIPEIQPSDMFPLRTHPVTDGSGQGVDHQGTWGEWFHVERPGPSGPGRSHRTGESGVDHVEIDRGTDLGVQSHRDLVRTERLDRVAHLDPALV